MITPKLLGGAETFIFELINQLRKKGHSVKLVGGIGGETMTSFFSRFYSFKHKAKISKHIEKFCPDLVHVNNCAAIISPSVIFAAKREKIPVILNIHDHHWMKEFKTSTLINPKVLYKFLKIKLHRYLINKSGVKIIVASKFMNNLMVKKFSNKFVLIHYGINIPKHSTNYKKKILFAGRLVEEKGLQSVIGPLNNLKDYSIDILGEGPLKLALEKKYKNINFIGFQDPKKFYEKASILIMPSIWEEPFGLSVAEAMSYGICVIGSNIGGISEQIKHMETGLLFEPGNENDFNEKLNYLIKNPSEIKRMGNNANKFVKNNLDWNKIINQYENIYKKTKLQNNQK